MVTAAKAAFDLHTLNKPVLVSEYEIQQSTSPHGVLWCLGSVLCSAAAGREGRLGPYCAMKEWGTRGRYVSSVTKS